MNPASDRLPPPGPRIWAFAFAAWTLLALLSFAQGAAFSVYRNVPVDWHRLPVALADWWTCGMFTPAFYWMVRHFPLKGRNWRGQVLVHLLASACFVVAKTAIYTPIFRMLVPAVDRGFTAMLIGGTFADLLGYWAAVGVIHAVEYYRESQARALVAARLDGELRVAELENLKAQLQPHFLFNTLQAISTLIHRDPSAADRMLADLSELLRAAIRHAAAQEVALRDELAFLTRYLDIMRRRFGDRLTIELAVEEGVLDAMVPSLVLQPLAENAIRHGMADRTDPGRVVIAGRKDGASLILEVQDDGPGLAAPRTGTEGNGIGLANTRSRVARMYGEGHGIVIEPGTGQRGLTARLTIPLRLRPPTVP